MKVLPNKAGSKTSTRKAIHTTETTSGNSNNDNNPPTNISSSPQPKENVEKNNDARAVDLPFSDNPNSTGSLLSSSTLPPSATSQVSTTASTTVSTGINSSTTQLRNSFPVSVPSEIGETTEQPAEEGTSADIPSITEISSSSSSSSSSSGTVDVSFFELDNAYYDEIRRRGDILVQEKKATYDMDPEAEDNHGYRGLLRRKYGHVWQTRMMFDRISINAGYFDHPVLAAIAYDIAQTFLRPTLKNGNGTLIELNFPNSIADCRLFPMVPTRENRLRIVQLDRPGIPTEQGHFWSVDEEYYREIKRRSDILLQQGIVPLGTTNNTNDNSSSSSTPSYIGIQKHKRKTEEGTESYTYEAKLIYRRKWFYLGRFRSMLEAAVSYDYGTTFIRPFSLKNEGLKTLNFPGTISDCRIEGPIDPWPQSIQEVMNDFPPLPPPRLNLIKGGTSNGRLSSSHSSGGVSSSSNGTSTTGTGTGSDTANQGPSKRKRMNDNVPSGSEIGGLTTNSTSSNNNSSSNDIKKEGTVVVSKKETVKKKGNASSSSSTHNATASSRKVPGKESDTKNISFVSGGPTSSLLMNQQHSLSSTSILDLLVAANEIQTPMLQGIPSSGLLGHPSFHNVPFDFENSPSRRAHEKSLGKHPFLGGLHHHQQHHHQQQQQPQYSSSATAVARSLDSKDTYFSSAFTPRHPGDTINSPLNHQRSSVAPSTLVNPVKEEEVSSTTMGALNTGTNHRTSTNVPNNVSIKVPNTNGNTNGYADASGSPSLMQTGTLPNSSSSAVFMYGNYPPPMGTSSSSSIPTMNSMAQYPPHLMVASSSSMPMMVPPASSSSLSYPDDPWFRFQHHPPPPLMNTMYNPNNFSMNFHQHHHHNNNNNNNNMNNSNNNLVAIIPPISQQPYFQTMQPTLPSSSLMQQHMGMLHPSSYGIPMFSPNNYNAYYNPPGNNHPNSLPSVMYNRGSGPLTKSLSSGSLSFSTSLPLSSSTMDGGGTVDSIRGSPSTELHPHGGGLPKPSLDPQHFQNASTVHNNNNNSSSNSNLHPYSVPSVPLSQREGYPPVSSSSSSSSSLSSSSTALPTTLQTTLSSDHHPSTMLLSSSFPSSALTPSSVGSTTATGLVVSSTEPVPSRTESNATPIGKFLISV